MPLTNRPKWEEITHEGTLDQHEWTERLRIPGGWLYRSWGYGISFGLVFVPEQKIDPSQK